MTVVDGFDAPASVNRNIKDFFNTQIDTESGTNAVKGHEEGQDKCTCTL